MLKQIIAAAFLLSVGAFLVTITTAAECAGEFRNPTEAEIAAGISTCVKKDGSDLLGTLKLEEAAEAMKYLETKVCSGYAIGYDPAISPAALKETRVYFTAQVVSPTGGMSQVSIDSRLAICAAKFIQAADERGLQPCITAALRTPAHQKASCLDRSNDTVCGRQNNCTSFSYCPHVKGIALDITSPNKSALNRLAKSFGLKMGVSTKDGGLVDLVHTQPASNDCSNGGISDRGYLGSGSGGGGRTSELLSGLAGWLGLSGKSQECQQLEQQCRTYQGQACMTYAQRCQAGDTTTAATPPPSSPMVGAPPKSNTTGSDSGTRVEELNAPEDKGKDTSSGDTIEPSKESKESDEKDEEKKPVTVLTPSSSTIEDLKEIAVPKPTETQTAPSGSNSSLSEEDIARLAAEKTTITPSLPIDSVALTPQVPVGTTGSVDTTFSETPAPFVAPTTLSGYQVVLSQMRQTLEWMLAFVTPMGYTRSAWEESVE